MCTIIMGETTVHFGFIDRSGSDVLELVRAHMNFSLFVLFALLDMAIWLFIDRTYTVCNQFLHAIHERQRNSEIQQQQKKKRRKSHNRTTHNDRIIVSRKHQRINRAPHAKRSPKGSGDKGTNRDKLARSVFLHLAPCLSIRHYHYHAGASNRADCCN